MLLRHPSPWAQVTAVPFHPRTSNAAGSPQSPPSAEVSALSPTHSYWYHGVTAHTHTLNTSATAAASAPVLQDLFPVLVLCVLDPRTLALILLWVPAHQVKCQEGSPWLELPPMGKKKKNSKTPAALASEDLNSLPATSTCRSSVVLDREEHYSLTNVILSRKSGMENMPLCLLRTQKYWIPLSWRPYSHHKVKVFPHWNWSKKTGRGKFAFKYTDIKA